MVVTLDFHREITIKIRQNPLTKQSRYSIILLRTVHGGYHLFPREQLYDVEKDPHQLHNLAGERPDLCDEGARLILDWVDEQMKKSEFDTDPMWTVMRQGGPEHARGMLESYIKRLEGTPRASQIPLLREMYPKG